MLFQENTMLMRELYLLIHNIVEHGWNLEASSTFLDA